LYRNLRMLSYIERSLKSMHCRLFKNLYIYRPNLSVYCTCLDISKSLYRSLRLIKTMVGSGCKRSLSLWAKAIFLLFLILVARAALVVAARPSNTMTKKPRFGASSTHFPQSNRPVQPSAPNPCSYIPGKGECKPPK